MQLDADQAHLLVKPNFGLKCLQRPSAADKSRDLSGEKVIAKIPNTDHNVSFVNNIREITATQP